MFEEVKKKLICWTKEENIKENEPMKEHTSFRVGGPARLFLSIHSCEELSKIISYLSQENIPYFILGNGTNILVSDEGFQGVVLYLGKEFSSIEQEGNMITAGAAALLSQVARKAMEKSLTGLEFAAGIPGTVGGGTMMNAGAYGGELSQVITQVTAMNQKGEILVLEKEELDFGYRRSIFKKIPYIILQVTMSMKQGNQEEILQTMVDYQKARKEKQPLEYPSAGSTFKRPRNHYAGKLIMEAGLRGCEVGGAKVSEKHCGFVINTGEATAADIIQLMEKIQKTVKDTFGVDLEPEVIRL